MDDFSPTDQATDALFEMSPETTAMLAKIEAKREAEHRKIFADVIAFRDEVAAAVRCVRDLMIESQGADRWQTCESHCIECRTIQQTAGALISSEAAFERDGYPMLHGLQWYLQLTLIPALEQLIDTGSIGSCVDGEGFDAAVELSKTADERLKTLLYPPLDMPV